MTLARRPFDRSTSDFRDSLSGGGLARLAADKRRLMSGSATNSTFSPPANDGALAEFMLAEQRRALPPQGWRSEDLLCIVVGGHPRSEIADRPLGDWMARTIRRRLADRCGNASPLTPLVMSDFWYLNDRPLLQQPSIVIGEPGVNAAAAHHAVRLPQMLVLEDALRIHLDPEYPKLRACFWVPARSGPNRPRGSSPTATSTASSMRRSPPSIPWRDPHRPIGADIRRHSPDPPGARGLSRLVSPAVSRSDPIRSAAHRDRFRRPDQSAASLAATSRRRSASTIGSSPPARTSARLNESPRRWSATMFSLKR